MRVLLRSDIRVHNVSKTAQYRSPVHVRCRTLLSYSVWRLCLLSCATLGCAFFNACGGQDQSTARPRASASEAIRVDVPYFTPRNGNSEPLGSEDEVRVGDLIENAISLFRETRLTENVNTPWQVMHGIFAQGIEMRLYGTDGTESVKALDWLLDSRMVNEAGFSNGLLVRGSRGISVVHCGGERVALEDHPNQFLGALAELGVSLDRRVVLRDGSEIPIRDLFEQSLSQYNEYADPSFTLLAHAYYLRQAGSDEKGRDHAAALVKATLQYENGLSYCGGSHLIGSLVEVLYDQEFSLRELLPADVASDAEAHVERFVRRIQTNQERSGMIIGPGPTDIAFHHKGSGINPIVPSGHYLEWLPTYLAASRNDLETSWTLPLAVAVAKELVILLENPAYNYGALAHACRGLEAYKAKAEQLDEWSRIAGMSVATMNQALGYSVNVNRSDKLDEGATPDAVSAWPQRALDESASGDAIGSIVLEPRKLSKSAVKEGVTEQLTVNLANRGAEALKIVACKVSCGCSKTDYPDTWVAPGTRVPITFFVNTDGMMGNRSLYYHVSVSWKSGNTDSTVGELELQVLPGVRYFPKSIDFDLVYAADTPQNVGHVTIRGAKKVMGVSDTENGLLIYSARNGRERVDLDISLSRIDHGLDVSTHAQVEIVDSNANRRVIDIPIRGRVTDGVRATPSTLYFSPSSPTMDCQEEVILSSFRNALFKVVSVTVGDPKSGALSFDISPDGKNQKLRLKYRPLREGIWRDDLLIECSSLENGVVRIGIPFVVNVRTPGKSVDEPSP